MNDKSLEASRLVFGAVGDLYVSTMLKMAEAAIQRVRDLHKPKFHGDPMCNHCFRTYPCDTIRALDGEQG